MEKLKYTVIKDRTQYNQYCSLLEELLSKENITPQEEEEIELMTTLIEVYDDKHSQVKKLDPIQLIRSFMKEHRISVPKLMVIAGIQSRGHIYEILNYQKGLSKGVIRRLAEHFKIAQEALNRPYALRKTSSEVAATRPTSLQRAARKKTAQKRAQAKPSSDKKVIKKATKSPAPHHV